MCVHRSKRHKSGSMEEEADSPGGEYYHSPSSPASSSRNWTDDMEGGNRIRSRTRTGFIGSTSICAECANAGKNMYSTNSNMHILKGTHRKYVCVTCTHLQLNLHSSRNTLMNTSTDGLLQLSWVTEVNPQI